MKRIYKIILVISLLLIPITSFADVVLENPLKDNTVEGVIQRVGGFLFWIGISVAVIVILIAGINFITSEGEPEKVNKAQRMILYAVIGIAIMILANGIISLVRNTLGGDSQDSSIEESE